MSKELYIVGNWKMYKTAREAADYLVELDPKLQGCNSRIYLAVPFTSILSAARLAKNTKIVVGAQNMNEASEGAFTGEIAALMLKEAGAEFVILGHSERRKFFGETNESIHKKTVRALQDDLQPIVCIGEDLKERESRQTESVLRNQIQQCLQKIPKEDAEKIILAYEPIWAIGTGKSATPAIAQKAHAFCRDCLKELFGQEIASRIPILYGGSVKPDTAAKLAEQQDIDGVLVGGASLDPNMFAEIALNCEKIK